MKSRSNSIFAESSSDPRIQKLWKDLELSRPYPGVNRKGLKLLAKKTGTNHGFAQKLWKSEVPGAKLLALLVEDPGSVTVSQLNIWASEAGDNAVCTMLARLTAKTPWAIASCSEWMDAENPYTQITAYRLLTAICTRFQKEGQADQVILLINKALFKFTEKPPEESLVKEAKVKARKTILKIMNQG